MEAYYKYLIKIIATTKIKYNGEAYSEVIDKQVFPTAEAFKKGYKELLKKYGNHENRIFTYQKIRGSWYECPNPKIQV